jgi:hypothetical protein
MSWEDGENCRMREHYLVNFTKYYYGDKIKYKRGRDYSMHGKWEIEF